MSMSYVFDAIERNISLRCLQALVAGVRVGCIPFADEHSSLLQGLAGVQPTFLLGMSHFWNRLFCDYFAELEVRGVFLYFDE